MKTLIVSGLALVIVAAVLLAQTANLTGQWKGETKKRNHARVNPYRYTNDVDRNDAPSRRIIKLTDGKFRVDIHVHCDH